MHTTQILEYLKKHGEQFDAEIADAIGISLTEMRLQLTGLATRGQVMTCYSTRFENGLKVEGMKCRSVGYIPPLARGRKTTS